MTTVSFIARSSEQLHLVIEYRMEPRRNFRGYKTEIMRGVKTCGLNLHLPWCSLSMFLSLWWKQTGRERRKRITRASLPSFLARSLPRIKPNQLPKKTSYLWETNRKLNWTTPKFICYVASVFNFIHNGAPFTQSIQSSPQIEIPTISDNEY